jgi:tellurite resistance protein
MNSGVSAEIGLCLLLSAADGEISDDELFALTTRVGHLLGDDFPIDRLGGLVENELRAIEELGADAYVSKLPTRIVIDRRAEALMAACRVACADGLSPEEEEMVRIAARALELDPESIIPNVGYRDTVAAPAADEDRRAAGLMGDHDDEPDAATRLVAERLVAHGWRDPMQELRDAGIAVRGVGALALEYAAVNGTTLRIEHHPCDGSIRLMVTDANDDGPDLVVFGNGREADVCTAFVAMQDDLTLANLETRMTDVAAVARVLVVRDGELVPFDQNSPRS